MVYHDSLGYALTQSPLDRIIYIASARDHVTLGFFFGGNLPDPSHLLEGTGQRMRHVKVHNVDDAASSALAALVRAAWQDAQTSIPDLHRGRRKAN